GVRRARVERARAPTLAAGVTELVGGFREVRLVAPDQRYLARAHALQLANDRERDFGRAAEHDHSPAVRSRGGHAYRPPLQSPTRRARSDCSSSPGSTRARVSRKRSSSGYIASSAAGRMRASLDRYTR